MIIPKIVPINDFKESPISSKFSDDEIANRAIETIDKEIVAIAANHLFSPMEITTVVPIAPTIDVPISKEEIATLFRAATWIGSSSGFKDRAIIHPIEMVIRIVPPLLQFFGIGPTGLGPPKIARHDPMMYVNVGIDR